MDFNSCVSQKSENNYPSSKTSSSYNTQKYT